MSLFAPLGVLGTALLIVCLSFSLPSAVGAAPALSGAHCAAQQHPSWSAVAAVQAAAPLRLRGGKRGEIATTELWDKEIEELDMIEDDLRAELMNLRVAQQVGGQPGKVNKIGVVRKNIARVLTVRTSKARAVEYAKYEKAKFKPFDARITKHWTKAMRQRLNKYCREKKTAKQIKCIRHKVWGAGVRPLAKAQVFMKLEKNPVQGMKFYKSFEFEKKPPHKYGNLGKRTDTGHVPEHGKVAMEKKKAAWKKEKDRIREFNARRAETRMDD